MLENEPFRINNAVLANRIEEIKRNPDPKFLEYKQAHPEFKTVACELLAAYAGISVSTLKNLKQGKLTDANCSTIYLICSAFDLDPAGLLNLPRGKTCDPVTCGNTLSGRLEEKDNRIKDLAARCDVAHNQLVSLHTTIRDQSLELGEARGQLKEKDAALERRNKGVKLRNRIICVLVAILLALLVANIFMSGAG